MKIFFYCRGSVSEGLGHLSRTHHVARMVAPYAEVRVAAVGDKVAQKILFDCGCEYKVFANDDEAFRWGYTRATDAVVFDALTVSDNWFQQTRSSSLLIALSPIFDHLAQTDILYHRTSIMSPEWSPFTSLPKIKAGVKYAVVGDHCRRIPLNLYRKSINSNHLSIAISMGGADAYNRTLDVVNRIRNFNRKLRIWVILGEGYSHSYQDLVDSVNGSKHEIILAKTNDSIWRILVDSAAIILAGGVSTYEAAYVGLPSVNLLETKSRYFLIKELVDAKACLYAGLFSDTTFSRVYRILENLYLNRTKLLEMRKHATRVVDGKGAKRIAEDILRNASAPQRMMTMRKVW